MIQQQYTEWVRTTKVHLNISILKLPDWVVLRVIIKSISFLRLDGDLYVSTIQPLEILWDKLSVGGFIYVDDYGSFQGCRNAVNEFRKKRNITTPMVQIEERDDKFEAVWWQKE